MAKKQSKKEQTPGAPESVEQYSAYEESLGWLDELDEKSRVTVPVQKFMGESKSGKAYHLIVGPVFTEVWVPKSQVELTVDKDGVGIVAMPIWLAKERATPAGASEEVD